MSRLLVGCAFSRFEYMACGRRWGVLSLLGAPQPAGRSTFGRCTAAPVPDECTGKQEVKRRVVDVDCLWLAGAGRGRGGDVIVTW